MDIDTQEKAFRIDCIDVGHGSAVVISADGSATMIDTGPGGPILEYLRREGINEVETVILSHADQDHIAGLVAMIDAGFVVRNIICNSDAAKQSKLWKALVYSLDDMLRRGTAASIKDAVEGARVNTVVEDVVLEILAPRIRISKLGPGSTDASGKELTTNTLSVVVMVIVGGRQLLLFTGDIDAVGCEHLFDSGVDLKADYLVVPHHGGMMGNASSTRRAIGDLCKAVEPKQIFVSNGRLKYDNPQPVVIEAIREYLPSAPIACSQLSQRCSASGGPIKDDVSGLFAQGHSQGHSCAGSIRLTMEDGISSLRDPGEHEEFIRAFAPNAMCRVRDILG